MLPITLWYGKKEYGDHPLVCTVRYSVCGVANNHRHLLDRRSLAMALGMKICHRDRVSSTHGDSPVLLSVSFVMAMRITMDLCLYRRCLMACQPAQISSCSYNLYLHATTDSPFSQRTVTVRAFLLSAVPMQQNLQHKQRVSEWRPWRRFQLPRLCFERNI